MTRIIYVFVLALLLSGCISPEAVRMPIGLENYSGAKAGQVFGSIGAAQNAPYSSVEILFRKTGSSDSGRFVFAYDSIAGGVPLDIRDKTTRGATVFSARLPEGEYEIFQVSFFLNRGQFGSTTFTAKEDFSIPFSIKEGQSTYLGEFISYHTTGKNFFGMSIPWGGYFVVSDKLQRDTDIFVKKPSTNTAWPIVKSVVNPGSMNNFLFQDHPIDNL